MYRTINRSYPKELKRLETPQPWGAAHLFVRKRGEIETKGGQKKGGSGIPKENVVTLVLASLTSQIGTMGDR